MYIYKYIHIRIHTYIYMCIYVCIYTLTHTYICIYIHTHAYIHIFIHVCVYVCMYVYTHDYKHMYGIDFYWSIYDTSYMTQRVYIRGLPHSLYVYICGLPITLTRFMTQVIWHNVYTHSWAPTLIIRIHLWASYHTLSICDTSYMTQRVYTFVGSHTHYTYTFVGFLSHSRFAYIYGPPFARFFPTHEWYLFQLIDIWFTLTATRMDVLHLRTYTKVYTRTVSVKESTQRWALSQAHSTHTFVDSLPPLFFPACLPSIDFEKNWKIAELSACGYGCWCGYGCVC